MSQFEEFNAENKLRIPLSWFAAQTIDSDCLNFSIKKTTLINTVITNYADIADCSISIRLKDYRNELSSHFKKSELKKNEEAINTILIGKANTLIDKYAKRSPSDVNWQITLNKKVKGFLTEDPSTNEETYYGTKPGHYVRALIEEYTRLPYYQREEIIFKDILQKITDAINSHYCLKIINKKGIRLLMKPYKIVTDPLSMYHYIVGYIVVPPNYTSDSTSLTEQTKVQSIRISRLTDVEIQHYQPAIITEFEEQQILDEIEQKGVQFVSGEGSRIKVWLSDYGIKKYNSQIHLRPVGEIDKENCHIYTFECTEAQALYYFFSFGQDAKILCPSSLVEKFKNTYSNALELYKTSGQ